MSVWPWRPAAVGATSVKRSVEEGCPSAGATVNRPPTAGGPVTADDVLEVALVALEVEAVGEPPPAAELV